MDKTVFSRTYENQINKMILDDRDYEIPRESLLNYVYNIIDIPYSFFLDFISNYPTDSISLEDLPFYYNIKLCEKYFVNYMLETDNSGVNAEEYGYYCSNQLYCLCAGREKTFGRRHLQTSEFLGLSFLYFDYWYLNCIGYVYDSLTEEEQKALIARTLLRNNFFRFVVPKLENSNVLINDVLPSYTDRQLNKYVHNLNVLLRFIIEEANTCFININRIIGKSTQNSIEKYIGNGDILSIYQQQIRSNRRRLSVFECQTLGNNLKNGSINSRNKLILGVLNFAYKQACRFKLNGLDLMDFIQEANLALFEAAEKYDSEKEFHFASYAQSWIYLYVHKYIISHLSLLHFPTNYLSSYKKIKEEQNKQWQILEREPSFYEISLPIKDSIIEYISKCPDEIQNLIEYTDYSNIVSESDEGNAEYNLQIEDKKKYINSLLSILSNRARSIIEYYYGLNGKRELSLESIGEIYKLSRERVRQIKEKAIRTLREYYMDRIVEEPYATNKMFFYEKKSDSVSLPLSIDDNEEDDSEEDSKDAISSVPVKQEELVEEKKESKKNDTIHEKSNVKKSSKSLPNYFLCDVYCGPIPNYYGNSSKKFNDGCHVILCDTGYYLHVPGKLIYLAPLTINDCFGHIWYKDKHLKSGAVQIEHYLSAKNSAIVGYLKFVDSSICFLCEQTNTWTVYDFENPNNRYSYSHGKLVQSKTNTSADIEEVQTDNNGNVANASDNLDTSENNKADEVDSNNVHAVRKNRIKKKWSHSDLMTLQTACLCGTSSLEETAELLGRTKSAVIAKLRMIEYENLDKNLNVKSYYSSDSDTEPMSESQILNFISHMSRSIRFGIFDPGKCVMLLAVIELMESKKITNAFIEYTEDLVDTYKIIWELTVPDNIPFVPSPYNSFILLSQEPFWNLVTHQNITEVPKQPYYNKDEFESMFASAEFNPSIIVSLFESTEIRVNVYKSLVKMIEQNT